MWDQALENDFKRVEEQQDEQARGRMFEDVVRKLFERARFHVTRNAGAATPRQTDLFARRGDDEYLIEVKWRINPPMSPTWGISRIGCSGLRTV
jgi:hypothetical protein